MISWNSLSVMASLILLRRRVALDRQRDGSAQDLDQAVGRQSKRHVRPGYSAGRRMESAIGWAGR
jgi:flagella basal body P-ring formation protein FlgA